MNTQSSLKLILLGACCSVMMPILAEDVIYCPSVTNLPELCEGKSQYLVNPIPFPNCLIMQVNKRYVFNGGATWQLNTVRPPYLRDPLQFITANIDSTGTHCIYKTEYHNHYVRFSYANGLKLLPASGSSKWKETLSGKHHGLSTNAPKVSGNIYICNSNGDATRCPMLKPQS